VDCTPRVKRGEDARTVDGNPFFEEVFVDGEKKKRRKKKEGIKGGL